METERKKPEIQTLADLFGITPTQDANHEKVQDIALSEIDGFPEHPFQVKMDESMQAMAESVKIFGIQTPAIVRQKDDGRYELISGHRRKMACEIAGVEEMPCIVRELNRDEATIIMVDSNLQREVILPSEKAKSYKMKLDAMKRQGQRTDLTCYPMDNKLAGKKSLAIVGESNGDSQATVHRYIRLTELIPQMLDMVDNGKIAMRPAVELSYLSREQQTTLMDAIDIEDCTPSHVQALKMRKFAEEGRLNEDVIYSIMQEEKPNQQDYFKMPRDKINKFFPVGTPAQKVEEIIVKALELYRQRERQRNDSR